MDIKELLLDDTKDTSAIIAELKSKRLTENPESSDFKKELTH